MRFRDALLTILCLASFSLRAENLSQVYALAVDNDPTLQAAYAALKASEQALPLAMAQMLPNLSAKYQTSGNASNAVPVNYLGSYNTKNYSLNLQQPLYHPEHWAYLEQARHIVKGAGATYLNAAQELILRVSQQYFTVLAAIDELNFTQSQTKAFARELEQSQQRFEVGLIAITDVQDAKARYDSAYADEIAAQNTVSNEYEKVRQIIGIPIQQVTLFPLSRPLPLSPPVPQEQETWVDIANQQNLNVIAAKEKASEIKAAIGTQVAGHFPKFDLTGSLSRYKAAPPYPFDELSYTRSITLNISVPIFAGGSVIFKTQEIRARYEEAQKQLETQIRATDSATRQAYRGVLTAISRVQALNQAVASNQSALESTQAAYGVGTRTMVDVLNAQTNLLKAKRDQAKARYNYLLEGLKLKQAAGTLTSEDVIAINDLMLGHTT